MEEEVSHSLGLHYGSMALYTSILHNLFLLYHVDMFVSVYKIDKLSFWVGETIFLVWNSCNDPLFGWISDRRYLSSVVSGGDAVAIVRNRIRALKTNGPLFAVSFVTFWFAWTFPSLQFVVCLCLYDGFLTVIDLHHSALLADLAVNANVRARLKMYCSVFSAIGALSVFVSYIFWNHTAGSHGTVIPFQMFCVILAALSIVGFLTSTVTLERLYCGKQHHQFHEKADDDSCDVAAGDSSNELIEEGSKALKRFVYDLAGHNNFMWFTAMNLVQVFHCHFNSNFFPLFIDKLLGDDIPPVICSVMLGVSFMAPHINNLYFLTLCQKYGVYFVVRLLFWIKLLLSIGMLFIGVQHIWMVGLFIASNRVFTEGTCKLLNLVISDLVDEDVVLHSRPQAVSALMFGTVALLSKPGQTLAPLIGTWVLSVHTGHDVFATGGETGSIKLGFADMTQDMKTEYQLGVFHLVVYVPLICAVVQLCFWSRFSLHGKRLNWIKSMRGGLLKHAVV